MKPPRAIGKIIYIVGYPVFRYLIKDTNRAYILVRYKNKVLLTQNWLGFQNKWRLPGGGIKHQEHPSVAAARELNEEVGINIDQSQLILLTKKPIKSKFNYNYWLFELILLKQPRLIIDEREILNAKLFNKKELNKLTLSEESKNALNLTNSEEF